MRIYIILALLLFSAGLYAQRNYKAGYIITNSNDSITGLLDFRTDKMNGMSCRFKKTENAEEQLLYPQEITRYRFINEGKYYISHQVEIDSIPRQVFLEYLLQGMMDLFYYVSENDQPYYFFMNEEGRMISLTKKPDEVVESKLRKDRKYKGILQYMFSQYPSMEKSLKKSSFKRGDLIELTKEYHDLTCTSGESCVIFENDYKRNFIQLEFSPYAGIQFSDYQEIEYFNYGSMKSINPMIGGQISIGNPRWSQWISFQTDLSLSSLKGIKDYIPFTGGYDKYEFKGMMGNAKFNLKYTIPVSKKFRPTIQAGFSYILLFGSSAELYQERRYAETVIPKKEDVSYAAPKGSYIGFNVGAGLNYMIKNSQYIFGQISYEKCDENGNDKIQNIQFKVGYSF